MPRRRTVHGTVWVCERPGYWVSQTVPPLHCYCMMDETPWRMWEVYADPIGEGADGRDELLAAEMDMTCAMRAATERKTRA